MTEAAEEIRATADPEANIIFGTSFNERLGDEVMITVIATGLRCHPPQARTPTNSGDRPRAARREVRGDRARPRERDFLEELERQRLAAYGSNGARPRRSHRAMTAPLPSRATGVIGAIGRRARSQPAAPLLRRRRSRDPELPPPQVAGRRRNAAIAG